MVIKREGPWISLKNHAPGRGDVADILAKTWHHDRDHFEFRRFTDRTWVWNHEAHKHTWDVPEGWRPVAYMPLPPIPPGWED